jgi:hypothetical protein
MHFSTERAAVHVKWGITKIQKQMNMVYACIVSSITIPQVRNSGLVLLELR